MQFKLIFCSRILIIVLERTRWRSPQINVSSRERDARKLVYRARGDTIGAYTNNVWRADNVSIWKAACEAADRVTGLILNRAASRGWDDAAWKSWNVLCMYVGVGLTW